MLALLLALAEAAADATRDPSVVPWVGGGVGATALVVVVHRVSVAIDRLSRRLSDQLDAWGEHRRRESEWWSDMRGTMESLREERRQREAALLASERYAEEQRRTQAQLKAVQSELLEMRGRGVLRSS